MSSRSIGLEDHILHYLLSISLSEHSVLAELREFTSSHRLAKMQISPEQGQFMAWLVRLINAKRYLEIGVFTGYSTLAMALALPKEGEILACDVSQEFTATAQLFWQKAGVDKKIQLVLQPALKTLKEQLNLGKYNYFDFAFIDADKPSYLDYFEYCLALIRPGGIIAIDNVFLNGRVVNPKKEDPNGVHLMAKFNASLKKDDRVWITTLPISDGLTLCIKR